MQKVLFLVACLLCSAQGDTPANCTYDELRGDWTFYVGKGGHDNTLNCTSFTKNDAIRKVELSLLFPDVAESQTADTGFWTLIYNQGWEVRLSGYRWFAYADWKKSGKIVTSLCSQTKPGWVHDDHDRDWACFMGEKKNSSPETHKEHVAVTPKSSTQKFKNDQKFVDAINKAQDSWTAVTYPHFENMTISQMQQHIGVVRTTPLPSPATVTEEQQQQVGSYPTDFDWRNINGRDFVTPVRNQQQCGSCYSFASMAMMEARWRIATNLTTDVIFAPQDILNCGNYSQGCAGGFPYLLGKYGMDFGLVDEKCSPYQGHDGKCHTPRNVNCGPKYFTAEYNYVGGFYGACNAVLMMKEVFEHGPIAVSFQVYSDLINYKSGVYIHKSNDAISYHPYDPFELTDHSVLITGWGVEKGLPYWSVKNSWGTTWGDKGYFKILRGVDMCAIESVAVHAKPGFTA